MSQFDHISDEELQRDIINTRLEAEAYEKIADGFGVLGQLPENKGEAAKNYRRQSMRYDELRSDAFDFLYQLYDIQEARIQAAQSAESVL